MTERVGRQGLFRIEIGRNVQGSAIFYRGEPLEGVHGYAVCVGNVLPIVPLDVEQGGLLDPNSLAYVLLKIPAMYCEIVQTDDAEPAISVAIIEEAKRPEEATTLAEIEETMQKVGQQIRHTLMLTQEDVHGPSQADTRGASARPEDGGLARRTGNGEETGTD